MPETLDLSTTGDAISADTCPPLPPSPGDDASTAALVGVLDDLATAAADPLAFVPAAAVILWYWLRKRRISAKPPQKV